MVPKTLRLSVVVREYFVKLNSRINFVPSRSEVKRRFETLTGLISAEISLKIFQSKVATAVIDPDPLKSVQLGLMAALMERNYLQKKIAILLSLVFCSY